jgi:hypothetical protein
MTNGKNPPVNGGGHEPEHGDPPVNADGVALPPAPDGGRTVAPRGVLVAATWLFVAVPRTGGEISEEGAAFFNGIVFNNASQLSWCNPYDKVPSGLEGMIATVAGQPAGVYPLSNYWVALYFLNGRDSVRFPAGPGPEGLARWTQNVPMKQVVLPQTVLHDVETVLVAERGTPKA